ncbi:MAG TPA: hypothetical protein VFZ49_04350 [Pyrinomonadaceae bacterium]
MSEIATIFRPFSAGFQFLIAMVLGFITSRSGSMKYEYASSPARIARKPTMGMRILRWIY